MIILLIALTDIRYKQIRDPRIVLQFITEFLQKIMEDTEFGYRNHFSISWSQ